MIRGRVTEAISGAPINGARVTITMVVDEDRGTFGRNPRQTITAKDGAFAFDALQPGQYILNVEKTGFASYPDVLGETRPGRLTVDARSDTTTLDIALQKGAVIAGRILSADGEPEADLGVSALRRTRHAGPFRFVPTGQSRTNDLGEFRIWGLAAGDYLLVAAGGDRHGPFDAVQTSTTTRAPTYFPGTLDESAARVTALAAGQVVIGIEFAIATAAAFRVSGIVVDRDGRPSPHGMIWLVPDMRTSAAMFAPITAMAGEDGTFTIGEVLPGTYRISASANAGGEHAGVAAVSLGFAEEVDTAPDAAPRGPRMITVVSADLIGLRVVVQ